MGVHKSDLDRIISTKKPKGNVFGVFGAGGGGRTRTLLPGLDFESSTSANSITPAYLVFAPIMVLVTGLEPVRYCYRGILSPLRLPISPHQHNTYILIDFCHNVKI